MPEKLENLMRALPDGIIWGSQLSEAMTHRSYASEHNLNYDNQRLEFLGDAVLEILLSEYLYRQYPEADEGELTKLRAALARESTIAGFARKLRLGDFLRMGKGELEAHGNQRESTVADLFESVLGAIYLAGGLDTARDFLLERLRELGDPRELNASSNPKGALQEFSQSRWGITPEYEVLKIDGPEHCPVFTVEARLRGRRATASAGNRRQAECEAALALYRQFDTASGNTNE